MRVESFQITNQITKGRPQPSKWIELLVRCYAFALQLYPQSFKASFADEMLCVFAMTLREASSVWIIIQIICREVLEFPMNLFRQHAPCLYEPRNIWRTRQVTRWSSLILSLFMVRGMFFLFSERDFAPEGIAFFTLVSLTLLSMLLSWRWERIGGLLTMGCGVVLAFFLIFYIAYFRPVEVSFIGLTLIGILWALPFFTFGVLFYKLSYQPPPQKIEA